MPGRTDTGVQHLSVAADGSTVLIDYPSFDGVALVDIGTGTTVGTFSAADPSAPPSSLPPVSWTSSLSSDGSTVASFDLAGRGYAFDTADGHLLTGLTGGHTSLVSDSFFNDAGLLFTASVDGSLRLWNPRASETEVSGDLSDDLCREFGGRIDDDSWQLAFEDDDLDVPCPAAERARARSAEGVELRRRRLGAGGEHPEHGGLPGHLRRARRRSAPGSSSCRPAPSPPRSRAAATGWRSTASESATPRGSRRPTSGAGATWAVSTTQGRSRGACGLYVTDGATQVTVTLDRDAATGTLAWFNQVGNTHNEPFTIPVGTAGELSLVDDGGVLAVLLGGRRVATVVDPVLRPPTGVGVATHGDAASCDFDDITLTTAP